MPTLFQTTERNVLRLALCLAYEAQRGGGSPLKDWEAECLCIHMTSQLQAHRACYGLTPDEAHPEA
jgi:hypothetical protein